MSAKERCERRECEKKLVHVQEDLISLQDGRKLDMDRLAQQKYYVGCPVVVGSEWCVFRRKQGRTRERTYQP